MIKELLVHHYWLSKSDAFEIKEHKETFGNSHPFGDFANISLCGAQLGILTGMSKKKDCCEWMNVLTWLVAGEKFRSNLIMMSCIAIQ